MRFVGSLLSISGFVLCRWCVLCCELSCCFVFGFGHVCGTICMRVALVLRSAEVQPLLRDLCDTPTEGVVVVIANSPPQCLSVGKSDGGPKAGGVWLVTSSCRCCTKDKSTAYGRSWRMLLAAATLLAGSESPESQCRGRRGMMDLFQRVSGYLRVLFDMSRINQVAN